MTVTENTTEAEGARPGARYSPVLGVLTTRLGAAACLALVLVALTFAMDHRGFLGTDTGGKVATLDQMIERGDWRSDVGYWASELDPDGDLHPLYFTSPVGEQWVNATSLPMLLLARPLWAVGGYQLALLLPIAGTVASALAAWAIAERVRSGRGALAFWIVGLAGPLAIYSLDLWEHSLGAALIGWAFVLGMDALRRPPVAIGLALGLLTGVAATMRTESFVYGAVIVGGAALHLLIERRRLLAPLVLGGSAAVALAVVIGLNSALETQLMDGSYRSGRVSGAASTIGSDLGLRAKEAVVTGVGLFPSMEPRYMVFGLLLLGALCLLVTRGIDDRVTRLLAGVVGALYLLRILDGPGFVPGLIAAAPIATVALVRGHESREARWPLGMALVAIPLVWLSQYTGGATPQWAGRYLLPSMLVLTAIGVALLGELTVIARRTVVTITVVVTAFGLIWASQRTHSVAEHGEQLVAASDGAVISDVAFWLREVAAFYEPDRPWLTAQGATDRAAAVELLEEAGFEEFDVLHLAAVDAPAVPGYDVAGMEVVGGLPGIDFALTHYVAE